MEPRSEILKKPYFAKEVITLLPLDIIKICDQYWQKSKKRMIILDMNATLWKVATA